MPRGWPHRVSRGDHGGMIRRGILAVVAVLALAACSGGGTPPRVPPPADTVPGSTLLAKTDGWRADLSTDDGTRTVPYVLVEIAYDAASARRAWTENAPADAQVRTGEPYRQGRHGRLEDVDLTRQRVVVVSAGESGSCPGWIRGAALGADGRLDVFSAAHVTSPDGACTADYRPYRTVLAVDASRLPAEQDLADGGAAGLLDGSSEVGDGVLVVRYPYAPARPQAAPTSP